MKINLIIFLSKFGIGGAGNSIFRLCKGLSKKKFKRVFLALDTNNIKSEILVTNKNIKPKTQIKAGPIKTSVIKTKTTKK